MWTGTQTFIDTCDMSDSKVAAVRIMEGDIMSSEHNIVFYAHAGTRTHAESQSGYVP